ncbi:ThuA domain-containing protein [Sporobolomyces koalae]|uniref:ThuA domain-containing protein n=1 Tax=Sporobolomyces koalae TaxID=500713 RepID=UPI00317A48C4
MRTKYSAAAGAILLSPLLVLAQTPPPAILVYSATAGYRHDSIPTAIEALQGIADRTNLYMPTFSEDPNQFTSDNLRQFKSIVFLSNSDQVLTSSGEAALEDWLTTGGSLVGLHAATACLFNNTAFGTAMGSWFHRHPTIQNATFTKVMNHETIDMLPDRYNTYEEVYSFRSDPRAVNATVLLTVDPDSYQDSDKPTANGVDAPYYQGSPHPIAWYRDANLDVDLSNGSRPADEAKRMNGRMWMTSLGHTNETWQSEFHLAHVEAGLRWALEDFSSSNSSASSSTSQVPTSSRSVPSTSSSRAPATTANDAQVSCKPLSTVALALAALLCGVL